MAIIDDIRFAVTNGTLIEPWFASDLITQPNIQTNINNNVYTEDSVKTCANNYSITQDGAEAGYHVRQLNHTPLFYRIIGNPNSFRLIPIGVAPPIFVGANVVLPDVAISYSKNLILYGPPGTGKTYSVIDYTYAINHNPPLAQNNREDRQNDFNQLLINNQIRFVTFHQSFGYEEFVEGIRAETVNGNIHYDVKDGVFKSICVAANNDLNTPYILIIDEINRGNISKIFGELITLIEPSKRTGEPEQLSVTLPYSGDSFSVPNNLYIIGTMNTADRSLALIDTALRRRFDFIEMQPQPNLLAGINVQGVNIEQMLIRMNQRIEVLYDREHTLGHAFFMHLSAASPIDALAEVFKVKIIPLLQEYFFEDWEKIRIVLGDDQKPAVIDQFVIENAIPANIFSGNVVQNYRLQNVVTYSINPNAFTNPASYQQI